MTRPITNVQIIMFPTKVCAKAPRVLALDMLENSSRLATYLGDDYWRMAVVLALASVCLPTVTYGFVKEVPASVIELSVHAFFNVRVS